MSFSYYKAGVLNITLPYPVNTKVDCKYIINITIIKRCVWVSGILSLLQINLIRTGILMLLLCTKIPFVNTVRYIYIRWLSHQAQFLISARFILLWEWHELKASQCGYTLRDGNFWQLWHTTTLQALSDTAHLPNDIQSLTHTVRNDWGQWWVCTLLSIQSGKRER
jgi:hypothetical protein